MKTVNVQITVEDGALDECGTRYFAIACVGAAMHRRYGADAAEAEAKAFAAAVEGLGREARGSKQLPTAGVSQPPVHARRSIFTW
jgi:hypothetical protein